MEKIIIYGTGDLASQLYRYMNMDNRYEVDAFTVEKQYCSSDCFCGLPVIPFETIEKTFSPDNYKVLVCVGYNNMNRTRARVFDLVKDKGYKIASFIHSTATILTNDLGTGNIILENVTLSIGSKVGIGNIIYNNAVLSHDVKIGDFNLIAAATCFLGCSSVENFCFVGGNSTIKDKVKINDYSLIGAGTYINKSTKPGSVYVPIKAQKLKVKSDEILI